MTAPSKFRPGWGSALLALVIGAAGGFQAGLHRAEKAGAPGKNGGKTGAADAAARSGVDPSAAGRNGAPEGEKAPGSPATAAEGTGFGRILGMKDPVLRLAAMREMIRLLPPGELPGLLEELRHFAEAQQELDSAGSPGLVLQTAETIADTLLARGAPLSMDLMLETLKAGGDPEVPAGMMQMMFGKWAEQDPLAAKSWLEGKLPSLPDSEGLRKECAGNLVRAWVKTDAAAALSWIGQRPEAERADLVAPAFQTLSHVDSGKAAALLVERQDLPGREGVAGEMAGWWAKSEPAKALAWAAGLEADLAPTATSRSVEIWAQEDFSAARQGVRGLAGAARDRSLPSLLAHWPGDDLKGAAAFIEAEPPGPGRQEASGKLISEWALKDQESASAWLAGQTAGAERDAGARALAESVRATDPEAAGIWLSTVQDEKERRAGLGATLDSWYKQSPAAAMQWLENAPQLSPDDRAALLRRFRAP